MFLLAVLVLAAAQATSQEAVQTSICVSVAQPGDFDGKIVPVRAGFATDFRHFADLVDSECRGGVALFDRELAAEQKEVLRRSIGSEVDGGPGLRFTATFTGRFERVPEAANMNWGSPLRLVVSDMSGFNIPQRKWP